MTGLDLVAEIIAQLHAERDQLRRSLTAVQAESTRQVEEIRRLRAELVEACGVASVTAQSAEEEMLARFYGVERDGLVTAQAQHVTRLQEKLRAIGVHEDAVRLVREG